MSEKNPSENEDLMWQTHMQTLMRRKRNMEIAQTIDDALQEYYSERGLPVPEWKLKKDPQWWTDYLIELNIDPENP
jgi:type III secretory pathway component EscV